MTDLWQACKRAKPLALGFGGAYGAPSERIERLSKLVDSFLYTFENLEDISKRQNAFVERISTFTQTFDECTDFVYDYDDLKRNAKKFDKREPASDRVQLQYQLPRYVYTDEDIIKFEDRLRFQLYAMDVKLDDIILRAFIKATKSEIPLTIIDHDRATENWEQPLSIPGTSQSYLDLARDVQGLYTEIERLENTFKRMGIQSMPYGVDDKYFRKPDELEIMKIREALKLRIQEHRLQDDESPAYLTESIQFQDNDHLLQYSGSKLTRLDPILNKHSGILIRKRVLGSDEDVSGSLRGFDPVPITNNIRIPRSGGKEIFYRLGSIDIVEYVEVGKRFIVSTNDSGHIGIIHYLPSGPSAILYPFTKHEKLSRPTEIFGKNEVSLIEPCSIEVVGAVSFSALDAIPRYSFEEIQDMLSFQDALRKKYLLHTLPVDTVKSNRDDEASLQHLKLWSAVDDGQVSLSFYSHEVDPKSHFEFSLSLFDQRIAIPSDRSSRSIKITFKPIFIPAPPPKRRPSLGSLVRRASSTLHSYRSSRSSRIDRVDTSDSGESAISSQSTASAPSAPSGEVQTSIAAMGYLSITFSKSEHRDIFVQELKRNYLPKPSVVTLSTRCTPVPALLRQPYTESWRSTESPTSRSPQQAHPSSRPPGFFLRQGHTEPWQEVESPRSRLMSTTLQFHPTMFRVQGIPYSCLHGGTRHLIRKVLELPEDTGITTKSLAIGPDPTKLTAVVYFNKEIPEVLSSEDFLQTQELKVAIPHHIPADDKDESIEALQWVTFDTHFKNLTILRTVDPAEDTQHTVDICAVSGLGAHAWGSFRERGGPYMWLIDSLPKEFKGARIMTYGFDTRLKNNASVQHLEDLGGYLLSDIEQLRATLEYPRSVPLVFIAHSLGGLVVKESMIWAKLHEHDSFISSIKGLLFFGVPNEGMDIQSLRQIVRGQPNEELLKSLEKGSRELRYRSQTYSYFFKNYLDPPVAFFYENKLSNTAIQVGPGVWKLDGPLTHLVDPSSATCGFYNQHGEHICQSLEKNHSELVKFSGPDDGEYRHVLPILTRIIRGRGPASPSERLTRDIPDLGPEWDFTGVDSEEEREDVDPDETNLGF